MSEAKLSDIEHKLDVLLEHVKNIEKHLGISSPSASPQKTGKVVTPDNVKILS